MTARRAAHGPAIGLAFLLLFLVLGAGLVLASSANAHWIDGKKHQYQGKLEKLDDAYIGFDVKKKNGKRKIANLAMLPPLACGSIYGNGISFPFELKGKLGFSGDKITVKNRKVKFKLSGIEKTVKGHLSLSLRFKGKRATGTFQMSANLNPIEPNVGTCRFGQLTVSAKRGANVSITPDPPA